MKAKKLNGNTVLLIITIALFFVMYAVGCVIYSNKGFTHLQTFLNILINNAGLLCITCGMTCVMLTGGIDISVGSLVAMDCMILAVGMERWNMNAVLLCILVLAIGIVFGVVQGFCVSEYPAVHCDNGGNVLRQRHDSRDQHGTDLHQQQCIFCKACQYEDQPSVWLLYQQQGRGAGSVYPCIGNRGAARADSRIFHAPLYQVRQKPLRSRRK